MLKPLSPKTLEKRYAELGLKPEQLDLLHTYYLCFANLYGMIKLEPAWQIFKHYEPKTAIRKKDFIAFSGVVQREAGLPYAVFDGNEIYCDVDDQPKNRIIIHRLLISSGYGKFSHVYTLIDARKNKSPYLPPKEELLKFTEDRFYQTPVGKRLFQCLSELKTTGILYNFSNEPIGTMLDVDGNPIAGKRISDFVFYTYSENSEINYRKTEQSKEQLRREYRVTALQKVTDRIQLSFQSGWVFASPAQFSDVMNFLSYRISAEMRQSQAELILKQLIELNNTSNLWPNFGWRPSDMSRIANMTRTKDSNKTDTISLSIGPNMQKLLEDGTFDRKELEKKLKELGIRLEN